MTATLRNRRRVFGLAVVRYGRHRGHRGGGQPRPGQAARRPLFGAVALAGVGRLVSGRTASFNVRLRSATMS